ncbi:hypothetical protein NC651_038412 [Populus alba x Populus x berolinensis]|nr:hypothetical protein NC651_038412 [Populus alba x Populus x berolinensis]
MEYKELAREFGIVNWGPCTCSGLHLILHHRSGRCSGRNSTFS